MLKGYQFDRSKVTAKDDANLFSTLNRSGNFVVRGRGEGMAVTTTGLNVIVKTGCAIMQGRYVELIEHETLIMPMNATRELVITIDLMQINESTDAQGIYDSINNQLKIELVENVIQDDLTNGGLIYMLHLGTLSSTANSTHFQRKSETYREFKVGATPDFASDFNNALEKGTYLSDNESLPALLSVENEGGKIMQTYSVSSGNRGLNEMRRMNVGSGWSNWFDLYEPRTHHGQWTPVLLYLQGLNGFQPLPQVYYNTDNRGYWHRIGDRIFVNGRLSFQMMRDATVSASDPLAVGDLPFRVASSGLQANRELITIHVTPRLAISQINNALQTRMHGMTVRATSYFQLYTNNARLNQIRGTANSEGVTAVELMTSYFPLGSTPVYSFFFSGSYFISE